ncbi:hypothetical protein COU96_01625 [Candidatus Shapirobacteria bacterium CG10_big_fil_rev_8_21_14_0_10_38_14]|uniref:Uncharacterized protein n=1 Tax=Candidatus Shapirobacteria bacterium CG10_big_fil_rev_8_21_14_0_10_38_14 TaxID=1974483 RepID=A0A2M8L5I1_9BACT|nr:MAG: hypothetical protein COU96_01625 [Candidatus Shapirobacteria bacterium CG10_big_fil_rev_8_21_14_0_10_38_14]
MKKNKFVFVLILILTVSATFLILWQLFFKEKKTTQTAPIITPIPTPTAAIPVSRFKITPTPGPAEIGAGQGDSPSEIIESLKEEFPLFQYLPYQTENFLIDYLAPLHLKVILKSEKNKQEVLDWIKSHGVDPATHQFDWVIPES